MIGFIKSHKIFWSVGLMIGSSFGCGVKGDPLPPERPPELGRGKPSYSRATEGMVYPELPPINREKDGVRGEEDENDK